jgi:type I restriction enzyme M protein
MPNERITEDYVRDHFKNDPLFSVVKLEEQKTSVAKAKQCLAQASKSLTGKIGNPEFIITFPAMPDDIIVVECKASTNFHESADGDNPTSYAVDGALHYSAFLSKQYNVISIAVSGDTLAKLKISSFYQKMGEAQVSKEDGELLDVFSYIKRLKGEEQAQSIESAEITKTAIDLNKELNDYSIVEYERCTLVSAILLALQHDAFKASYKDQATSKKLQPTPARLAQFIVASIKNVLTDADIDDERVSSMLGEYEKIKSHSIAKSPLIKKKKASEQQPNYVLRDITDRLEKSVLPLVTMGDKGYDVLGRFYREFIRYAGTDKKTGLVITPQHITEFFCDVVSLNVNDVVYDSCCGSGGFLISAMKHMFPLAGANQKKRKAIRDRQLVGIERRTDMFTFACSNMMMSGDGKSHIYQGDSFANDEKAKVRSLKPTVGFLNPPYDVGEDGQLEFIENTLNTLQQGGRCCAVVQMSCVTSANARTIAVRERLLKQHTLTGVFSMPNDLFHPVGVITCVMVFEAKKPHPKGFKPFFGYFKNDGFQKTKHMGRVNGGQWEAIKAHWLSLYLNREKEVGLSVLQAVTAQDEWCAEAYMETDYSKLTIEDFAKTVRDYAIHKLTLANV